jgi:hypothetical protein
MNMWSWINHLDPNVVFGVVAGGLTWLYNKASGKKSESVNSIIDSIINNFVHELLDSYVPGDGDVTEYLKKARKYIEDRIWTVLSKRGIPKNSLSIKLVHEATERCTAWLASEIRVTRQRAGNGPVL